MCSKFLLTTKRPINFGWLVQACHIYSHAYGSLAKVDLWFGSVVSTDRNKSQLLIFTKLYTYVTMHVFIYAYVCLCMSMHAFMYTCTDGQGRSRKRRLDDIGALTDLIKSEIKLTDLGGDSLGTRP